MTFSLKIAACMMLALTAGPLPAQVQLSRSAQVLQEGLNPAARAKLAEAAKQAAASPTSAAASPLAKACRQVLGDATRIHDESRLLDPALHSLRFRAWMCESGFRSHEDMIEAATALDMANPDMGSMLGYLMKDERDAFTRQLGQFCATGYALHVDPAARENFGRQARANMTYAYGTCLDQSLQAGTGKSGVFAYAVPQDANLQRYTVKVRAPGGGVGSQITAVKVDGARCSASQRRADGQVHLQCARTGEGTAAVTVRTRNGEDVVLLPGRLDMARLDTEERLLGLRDRMAVLEQLAPQALADLRDAARQ